MEFQSEEPLVVHGRVIPAPPEMGDGWAVVVTEPVFAVVFSVILGVWARFERRHHVAFLHNCALFLHFSNDAAMTSG